MAPHDLAAPMSFAQERLWFLAYAMGSTGAYNVRKAWRMRGSPDVAALQAAIDAIVRRHEVLRTSFQVVDGRPMQIIAESLSIPLERVDLSGLDESRRETEAMHVLREEGARGFDLSEVPLLRALLVRLKADDHVLLLSLHHIVTDEWSGEILQRELAEAYGAYQAGRAPAFDDLPVQYADFATWQRERLAGDALELELGYWRQRMDAAPLQLDLPLDHPRSSSLRIAPGASESLVFSRTITQAGRELGRRHGTTTFVTMLAALKVLLFRYTGQSDIVVGSPIANRARTELDGLIGLFVNTLPLRTHVHGEDEFVRVLLSVRETALEAFDHQDLPFEKLVAELQPERRAGGTPFVNVLFVMRNKDGRRVELPGLSMTPYRLDAAPAKFDLTVHVSDDGGDLGCTIQYNAELFERASIRRMLAHFETLLANIAVAPDRPIASLPLLSDDERHEMLVRWNDTATDYGPDDTVHEAFAMQAHRTPNAVAVADDQATLTNRELDGRENELAHELGAQGVRHGDVVGVCVERSLEMVIATLAVLKAGGAYLPLDPEYPQDRLTYMLRDANACVVVTQGRLAGRLRELHLPVTLLEANGSRGDRVSAPPPCATSAGWPPRRAGCPGSCGRPRPPPPACSPSGFSPLPTWPATAVTRSRC